LESPEDIETRPARQLEVDESELGCVRSCGSDRFLVVGGGCHLQPTIDECAYEPCPQRLVIIDNEQRSAVHARRASHHATSACASTGSSRTATVPCPDLNDREPPQRSAKIRAR